MRLHIGLVHYPCVDRLGQRYTTALTNVDLHDIARSGRTYGVQTLWVVTPIELQRRMVGEIVRHWTEGAGAVRNDRRAAAMCRVQAAASVADAAARIATIDGEPPIWIATSAQMEQPDLDWDAMRARLRGDNRPMLLLFGTGWGMDPELVAQCPLRLPPIGRDPAAGPHDGYNHLSVRAAAAIALDRLLGAR